MMDTQNKTYSMEDFVEIVRTLRGENGCPWDKEQTHESLEKCLRDECEEVMLYFSYNLSYPYQVATV